MKNLERIIFYSILIIAIITVGVLIYAKVNDDTVDLLNAHIADLRKDNEQLIGELESNRTRVITIKDTLEEFERENNRLKDILERSAEIAGEAEEENRAITAGIDRALEIVRALKADYQGQ